ncbi:MAG: DUF2283 domain-containing protein [Spirochaeta sp.]|jgi:uncharacterized protein YuzE|nr:DUF2283 domain-containing protein [Spirochaeta sp.]
MTIRYFSDTDTALFDFTNHAIAETREISENLYVDIDEDGNVVSMTIEHAKESGGLQELVYREIGKQSA